MDGQWESNDLEGFVFELLKLEVVKKDPIERPLQSHSQQRPLAKATCCAQGRKVEANETVLCTEKNTHTGYPASSNIHFPSKPG